MKTKFKSVILAAKHRENHFHDAGTPIDLKICRRCQKHFPITEFHTRGKYRHCDCRWCVSTLKAGKWKRRTGRPTRVYRTEAIHKAKNAIRNAVSKGRIVKPKSCERCGIEFPTRKLQAHHEDYSLPFLVIWLCQRCHTTIHMLKR